MFREGQLLWNQTSESAIALTHCAKLWLRIALNMYHRSRNQDQGGEMSRVTTRNRTATQTVQSYLSALFVPLIAGVCLDACNQRPAATDAGVSAPVDCILGYTVQPQGMSCALDNDCLGSTTGKVGVCVGTTCFQCPPTGPMAVGQSCSYDVECGCNYVCSASKQCEAIDSSASSAGAACIFNCGPGFYCSFDNVADPGDSNGYCTPTGPRLCPQDGGMAGTTSAGGSQGGAGNSGASGAGGVSGTSGAGGGGGGAAGAGGARGSGGSTGVAGSGAGGTGGAAGNGEAGGQGGSTRGVAGMSGRNGGASGSGAGGVTATCGRHLDQCCTGAVCVLNFICSATNICITPAEQDSGVL
jgi:hypothetical protein